MKIMGAISAPNESSPTNDGSSGTTLESTHRATGTAAFAIPRCDTQPPCITPQSQGRFWWFSGTNVKCKCNYYVYIYMYMYTLTYVYICIHWHIYICIHWHIYMYTLTHIYIYVYIDIYICTYTYIYICTYTCIHIHIHIYIHIYIYIYIYIHVHIYTYIHIHIHISMRKSRVVKINILDDETYDDLSRLLPKYYPLGYWEYCRKIDSRICIYIYIYIHTITLFQGLQKQCR